MKRFVLLVLSGIFALLITSTESFADGKYFPAKAYRTSPTIHSQRAILKYKDGIETLVIESSFDGEGQDFGWVIPLPTKPTKFEEASAGFLETLSQTIQPEIIHDVSQGQSFLFWITGMVGIFFIIILFIDIKQHLLKLFLIFLLVYILATALFVPALGTVGANAPDSGMRGINVLGVQEAGNFDLAVIEADNSEVLNEWLIKNEFANLNETEREVIEDYIKEGWCFVAAKLKRDGEGYTKPHPLAMTFETENPVYPMRLTAAADSTVYLELFVIADQYASNHLLTTDYSGRLAFEKDLRNDKSGYAGFKRVRIGHPESDEFLWDNCIVTRLCDVLGPEKMKDDIRINFNSGKDHQKLYFSYRGAFDTGLMLGLTAWVITIILMSFLASLKKAKPLNRKEKIKQIFVPAVCLLAVIWAGTYIFADKIAVSNVQSAGWMGERIMQRNIAAHIWMGVDKKVFAGCATVEEVENRLEHIIFPEINKDSIRIKNIKFEDSSGNVVVLEDERGLFIRVFGRGGFYEDISVRDGKILE